MSADLFAEFSAPATNSKPNKQPHQSTSFVSNDSSKTTIPADPFGFSIASNTGFPSSNASPSIQWPTSSQPQPQPQPTSSAFNGWGNTAFTATQQQQQHQQVVAPSNNAEDEDGWGDFEVADNTPAPPVANPVPARSDLATIDWGHQSYPTASSLTSQSLSTSVSRATNTIPASGPATIDWGQSYPTASSTTTTTQPISKTSSSVFSSSQIGTKPKPSEFNATLSDDDFSWGQQQPNHHQQKPRLSVKSKATDPNVLFDADDFELDGGDAGQDYEYGNDEDNDDDFGDFEAVQYSPPQPRQIKPMEPASKPATIAAAPQATSMDLLSLEDPEMGADTEPVKTVAGLRFGAMKNTKPVIESNNSPDQQQQQQQQQQQSKSFQDLEQVKSTITKKNDSNTKKQQPISSNSHGVFVTAETDNDWAAWDDGPSNKEIPDAAPKADNWGWDASETTTPATNNNNTTTTTTVAPPINVPPPSIILSVFPELFGLGETLFKSVAGQSASAKQQIISSPKALEFLKGYVLLASTAARVIAGRKQRWHRDKILAKSMSISAAGSKGMKLAGVDKTQSAREDREAADVVAAWRLHVGKLRSAIAIANSSAHANLKVPEMAESMQIQTAKMVPTAAKACIICGLKRDERVAKVDLDVEDSFGEWWVDHWGHRACKNFWIEHEKSLRQR